MEKSIVINDGIGIKQLRHLMELSTLNKALNNEEFLQDISVYNKAINRILEQQEQS
ncbi:hypothetical protein [Clostridium sp. Marseille-Q7071]